MTTNRRFSLDLLDRLKLGGNNTSDSDPDQPVPDAPSLEKVLSEIGSAASPGVVYRYRCGRAAGPVEFARPDPGTHAGDRGKGCR